MTEQNFSLAWAVLLNSGLPGTERITSQTRDIYWKDLRGIPDDLWEAGIAKCRQGRDWFPTIHELGAACCGEQKAGRKWVEDAWRERGGYMEENPEITWQQNLNKILIDRGILPPAEPPREIEPPERPDYARPEPVKVRDLLQEALNKIDSILGRISTEQEKARVERMEKTRKVLEKQAKMLLGARK